MRKLLGSTLPFGITILLLVFFIQACGASTDTQPNSGSIKVDSVYTKDSQQKDKAAFAPGDSINYDVKVNNTMSSQSSIAIHFQVFATDYNHFVASHLYTYDHTTSVNKVQQGLSDIQTSASISSNVAPATYEIHITVTPSNTAFPSNSGQNSFTIQPPSQLGPFNAGTFTRDNGNVKGSAQLTLFQNGSYKFTGCMQNVSGGFVGYNDVFSWDVVSASGIPYQFNHTGSLSGDWRFWDPSHQDCWTITGSNKKIAADWIPLTFQKANHWDGSVNRNMSDWAKEVLDQIPDMLNDLGDVVEVTAEDA